MNLEQAESVLADQAETSEQTSEDGVMPRSRPSLKSKERITLQVDVDVVSMFRATGRGWQTRMNTALREWLGPPWAA